MPHGNGSTRRSFLDWLIALFSAITGAAVTFPGVMYLWPAARGGGGAAVEVPGATNLALGASQMIQVEGKAVIVVRNRNEFKAYSAVCTHLGCLVTWASDRKEFLCPCHGAVFDENGKVVSGPPPTPLPEYKIKEINSKVYVSTA